MEHPPPLSCSPSHSSQQQQQDTRQNLKRSHSKMSETSSTRDRSSTAPSVQRASSLPQFSNHPSRNDRPQQASDYPGRGLDYRRPVMMQTNPSNVIDLTGSDDPEPVVSTNDATHESSSRQPDPTISPAAQRLPRFARDIIDLDDEGEGEGEAGEEDGDGNQRRRASPSPEVEFMFSRPRVTPLQPREPPVHQRITTWAGELIEPFNPQTLFGMPRTAPHLGYMQRIARHMGLDSLVTPIMDYTNVSFDLGIPNRDTETPRNSPPRYEDIEPAREGFTRTPKEEDILICPNCGDELCAGESDVKKQVWVVRACGHVYCGECTNNRHVTKKGKNRAAASTEQSSSKPFASCVVHNCKSKVQSRTAMVQIFL